MDREQKKVALGWQLSQCKHVITMGIRPNLDDYEDWQIKMMLQANTIYFPTAYYVDLFHAIGKKTFPSAHTYHYLGDKIKQTQLFQLLGIPHPKTRIYFGNKQKENIYKDFTFPLIAKIPKGSSLGEGVYLIQNREDLSSYCEKTYVAYTQEYIPTRRDLRLIIIKGRVIHAYWRVAREGEFRTNLFQGGQIDLEGVPQEALHFATTVAIKCGFNHVGLDICPYQGGYLVLEANMRFGLEGLRKASLNYREILCSMIEDGDI